MTLHVLFIVSRAIAPRARLYYNDHFLGFRRVGEYGGTELITDLGMITQGLTEIALHPSTEDHMPYRKLHGNRERQTLLDDTLLGRINRLGIELTTWEEATK